MTNCKRTDNLRRAWNLGAQARIDGQTLAACPYSTNQAWHYRWWRLGYRWCETHWGSADGATGNLLPTVTQ